MGIIKYNNISSSDLGLIVQSIPTYDFAEKDITLEHVSGRNGDIIINGTTYKNVNRTYYMAKVFRKGETFVNSSNAIVNWLHSSDDYTILEDSYEPEYYRKAIFTSDGSLPNHYNIATTFELVFKCKPQKWLKIGDDPIDIVGSTSIENPTNYDSSPIFEFDIFRNTNSVITVNDVVMTFLEIPESKHIIIDCENMECYSSDGQSYNKYLKLNSKKFPSLIKSSINTITITNASNCIIKPKWWTL